MAAERRNERETMSEQAASADLGRSGNGIVAPPSGDVVPKCETAFRLGWHVAALHGVEGADPSSPPGAPIDGELPDLDRMPGDDRREALVHLINLETAQLTGSRYETQDVGRLNAQLLSRLNATDWRFAKAYVVGSSLERLTMHWDSWEPERRCRRMWEVSQGLTDLKSCFQPYAVDAVETTLSVWSARLDPRRKDRDRRDQRLLADALHRQGQIWRALLSGEKRATDHLQVPDYVEGAENVAAAMWRLACGALRRAKGLLLVTAIVVAGALSLAAVLGRRGQLGPVLGALAVGAGFLGATGASLKVAARRAINSVEHTLWQAELAAAIAVAIYVDKRDEGDPDAVMRLRSRVSGWGRLASLARRRARLRPAVVSRRGPLVLAPSACQDGEAVLPRAGLREAGASGMEGAALR